MCGTVTWVLINVTRGWVLPGGQVALLDGSGGESDGVPRGLCQLDHVSMTWTLDQDAN